MARKLSAEEERGAPSGFAPLVTPWSQTYQCELITPMVGGGITSWQPDKKQPVRSQSVKGQLRFWWRTMQNFPSAGALKAAEDQLWGSTNNGPRVRVQIKNATILAEKTLRRTEGNNQQNMNYENYPGYVLFPMQGQKEDDGSYVQSFDLITGLSFDLVVSSDSLTELEQQAVENSVALWILFGGLGARTRRGCGSLYCAAVMDRFADGSAIKTFLRGFVPATPPSPAPGSSPYPVLANCRFGFQASPTDPVPLWRTYLHTDYRSIRQENIGRDPGGKKPGRSRWPEPDVIRSLTGRTAGHPPRHRDQWFPRGAFGLPIQTKFNTHPEFGTPLDPEGEFTLRPTGQERWPSPLILKVIRLNATTSAKIWLLLNHTQPSALELSSTRYRPAGTPPGTTYSIPAAQLPSASGGKMALDGSLLPAGKPVCSAGTTPYDVLFTYLNVPEVP